VALPLPTIILQLLFMLISVAAEAFVLQWRMNLGRHRCVEYALAIELAVSCVGWASFFAVYDALDGAQSSDNSLGLLKPIQNWILWGEWSSVLNWWFLGLILICFWAALELKVATFQIVLLLPRLGSHGESKAEQDAEAATKYENNQGASGLMGVFVGRSLQRIIGRYQRLQAQANRDTIAIGHLCASLISAFVLGLMYLVLNLENFPGENLS
jgi:hypothetical protein